MERSALERLRHAVLHLHKAIVDDMRDQLEVVEGRLTPHQFFARLTQDPELAWLGPLSASIVAMDEWLDAADAEPDGADDLATELGRLLVPDDGGDAFQRRYADLLQRSPAIVLAHAGTVCLVPRRT